MRIISMEPGDGIKKIFVRFATACNEVGGVALRDTTRLLSSALATLYVELDVISLWTFLHITPRVSRLQSRSAGVQQFVFVIGLSGGTTAWLRS